MNNNHIDLEKSNDDRLRLLYLYQLLFKYSDAQHPLSTKNIQELMLEEYHIKLHRTTVPEYISLLVAAGVEIVSERKKSYVYYTEDRLLSTPELKLLIDAVQASKFINEKKTAVMVRKLGSLTSIHEADKLNRSLHISGKINTDNKKAYYIVDVLNEAIYKEQKVVFLYYDYDGEKQLFLKNDGCPYTVSPYDLIWDGDYYYLTGFCDEREEVRTFRVDRIYNIPEMLNQKALICPKDYAVEKYTQETFRMYSTQETTNVSLKCKNSTMKAIVDQFGIDVDTKSLDQSHFQANVNVCVSPTFFRWIFGWEGKIGIIGPQEVKMRYIKMLKDAFDGVI